MNFLRRKREFTDARATLPQAKKSDYDSDAFASASARQKTERPETNSFTEEEMVFFRFSNNIEVLGKAHALVRLCQDTDLACTTQLASLVPRQLLLLGR